MLSADLADRSIQAKKGTRAEAQQLDHDAVDKVTLGTMPCN